MVLIHAFPLNKSMWDDQVTALEKIARVITFDIRGFGENESDIPYTLEFIVDDLIELLDELKIEKVVVCGLSMGGYVALRAIERNPERFLGLVLANTKSEPDSDVAKLGRYKALKTIQKEGLADFAEGFIKSAVAPSTQKDNPKLFDRIKTMATSNTSCGVEHALLALISRTDTTLALGKIQVPTLVLQGELDTVIPLASAKALHEKIKGSEFFLIPKAGHLSNLENPEAFNAHLVKFIGNIKL